MPIPVNRTTFSTAQEKLDRTLTHAVDTVLAFNGQSLPNMGNMTPEGLVDIIGEVGIMEKKAKAVKETLKTIFRTKYPNGIPDEVRGDVYVMNNRKQGGMRLDQEAAKAILESIGRLDECMKPYNQDALYFEEQ